jgi:hypothetical protein
MVATRLTTMKPVEIQSGHRRLVGCLAVAIIGVGLILAVWLSRGLLVAETFEIDGRPLTCSIRSRRGDLSFHAEYGGGGSSVARIGDAAEIGTRDPKLSYDAATKQIRVQVGRGVWEFDPNAHYLREVKR